MRHGSGDGVDVQVRRVGRQHGVCLAELIETAEQLLLEVHVLVHRFDDHVGVTHHTQIGDWRDVFQALGYLRFAQAPALDRTLIVAAHAFHAAFERIGIVFDERYRYRGVGETHRNAAAHGASPDYRGALHATARCVLVHTGNFSCCALSEEQVA